MYTKSKSFTCLYDYLRPIAKLNGYTDYLVNIAFENWTSKII